MALAKRPILRHRVVPPRDDLLDRVPQAAGRAAGIAFGGGIQIDKTPLRIEHQHAVVHAVDDHVARHRHQAEQPVAIQAEREAGARHRERDGRDVEPRRQQPREVDQVSDPRHQCAGDDEQRLPAIRRGEAAPAARQRQRAGRDQQIAVTGVDPVPRPARIDEADAVRRRHLGDGRPVNVVALVGRGEDQRRHGDHPHDPPQHAVGRPRGPRVVAGEQQPEHADRGDAEVLELGDHDSRRRVIHERVQGARQAPHRHREHQPAKRHAAGHAAPAARDHRRPDRQARGRKERGCLHGCLPVHEVFIINRPAQKLSLSRQALVVISGKLKVL